MINWKLLSLAAVAPLVLATAAQAQVKIASGQKNGLSWQAQSRIIGQTPTSDVLPPTNTIGGGDPIYFPAGNKAGTVALIMEYANGDLFICSGSLVGTRSIVTAGHCVSDGAGTANPLKTTAYFYTGDPNERTPFSPNAVAIDVTRYHVHSGYTGEVIDQNDIAVLRLATNAPAFATSYELFTQADLTGLGFNVAGYGTRSTVGGAAGSTPPARARTGFLREGDNIYDYAWGNSEFGGFFTDRYGNGESFFGFADVEFSYVSDFDNGLAAQDTACLIAAAVGASAGFGCNLGVGAREVGLAGGDSGGPGFVNGRLASVNSYALTFGGHFGDFGGGLNSGWGEFSGYVPIYIHEKFIKSVVPEPATWAMMIAGFGLVGGALRRRRETAVSA
ncbi:MAG: PEPxxWA-CTERM sorting domain-containing protein [Sandarakinorhabdus sp.]|nr:PEPxxWA-CTERM sorting domain-containing protein [Sandarakinorhabdus sp.]